MIINSYILLETSVFIPWSLHKNHLVPFSYTYKTYEICVIRYLYGRDNSENWLNISHFYFVPLIQFNTNWNTHTIKYHSGTVHDQVNYICTQIYPDDITNIINEFYVTYIMTYNISYICSVLLMISYWPRRNR